MPALAVFSEGASFMPSPIMQTIFDAFSKLLKTKKFSNITVQEIIDEANIGRSTFYAHFETKDELLKVMCTDIFTHIFSDALYIERTHNFSENGNSLKDRITHMMYHLKDNKRDITGILSCESGELFMKYFKEYLREMFLKYVQEWKSNVPKEFFINYLTGSLADAVIWWISEDMKYTPEEITEFYMSVIREEQIMC